MIDHFASRDELTRFVGTGRCKVIFRRWYPGKQRFGQEYMKGLRGGQSTLCLLDYNAGNPEVSELGKVRPFAPVFHPDGTRAVYSTSFGKSDIHIQPLYQGREAVKVAEGAYPFFWIDPSSGTEYVTYRTECVASKTDHPGDTVRLPIDPETSQPLGEPEIIYPKGFTGGLSPDGTFLGTAIHWFTIANLRTGEEFHPLGHEPVCNATSAPDNSGRYMVLRKDHIYFSAVKYDGTELVEIEKPEGAVEWQTPKWSNHPDFAIAVAADENLRYAIYLVRLSDNEKLKLIWGDSYVHPNFWVG